jgi:hypothetical protein
MSHHPELREAAILQRLSADSDPLVREGANFEKQ